MTINFLDLAAYAATALNLLADTVFLAGWIRTALALRFAAWVAQGVVLLM